MMNRRVAHTSSAFLGAFMGLACHGVPPDLPPGSLDRPITPRVSPQDRPGTLRVRVLDSSGLPVPGFHVVAASPGHPDRAADTDTNGLVVFWELHPGVWSISASGRSAQVASPLNASVEPESVAFVTLQLRQAPITSPDPEKAP